MDDNLILKGEIKFLWFLIFENLPSLQVLINIWTEFRRKRICYSLILPESTLAIASFPQVTWSLW
jgi:hypothetical protein